MKSITIILHDAQDGRRPITPIRNEIDPRTAAEACQLAARMLLEEAIRAELEAEKEGATEE